LQQIRDIVRAVIYGVIAGLAVAILAVWAGTRDPLTVLIEALATFVVVAVAFEVLQQPWGRRWVPAMPIDVQVKVARRNALPKAAPVEIERGWLDYEEEFTNGLKARNDIFLKLRLEARRYSNPQTIEERNKRLAEGMNASIEKRQSITARIAKEMNAHTANMERMELAYQASIDKLTAGGLNWIRTALPASDFGHIKEFVDIFASYAQTNIEGNQEVRGYLVTQRNANVNRVINEACERQMALFDKLIADEQVLANFCRGAAPELEERCPSAKPQAPTEPPKEKEQ